MPSIDSERSSKIKGVNHYGVKVSKPGMDVSDNEQYQIMHTRYPVLKLKASGQGTASKVVGGGGFNVEITHNLGYVPICFVSGEYFDTPSAQVVHTFSDWNRWIYQGLQVADLYYYYADTTKLYIVLQACHLTDDYAFDLNYMYHIFYDEDAL